MHPVSRPKRRRPTNNMLAGRNEPTIDARYALAIIATARSAGFDTDRALRRAGLDALIVARPGARITRAAFEALLQGITRLTRDEFWLTSRRPIKIGTFRSLCKLLVDCTDLGEAIREGARFYRLVTGDFRVSLRLEGDTACLAVTDRLGAFDHRPQLHGSLLLFVYGLLCWLAGRRVPLTAVHHCFGWNLFGGELAKAYQAPMIYDRPCSELRFDRSLLDWPVVIDHSQVLPFLATVPGALLVRYQDTTSFSDRIKRILRKNVHEHLSLETVAAMLATSPQTLRRRLREEGFAGFQSLKDDVRRELAFEALAGTDLSIEGVALSLGFSEVSTFHRAFRRWSNLTPHAFRQAHAANSA